MDEILIGEKKYVSSKQAAKATGYAKDYIGQLCREGRVPARLVGRSWYVLESAIHDHRFGEPKNEPVRGIKPLAPQSTWESPRYEASDDELLPSINLLHKKEEEISAENTDIEHSGMEDERSEVAQHLQDTWQAWFDRFDHVADAKLEESKQEEEPAHEPEIEESEEIDIPIHTVYEVQYQRPIESVVDHREVEPLRKEHRTPKGGSRVVMKAIQLSGVLVVVVAVALGVLGTGYLDKYIFSNNQVSMMAGITLYNR